MGDGSTAGLGHPGFEAEDLAADPGRLGREAARRWPSLKGPATARRPAKRGAPRGRDAKGCDKEDDRRRRHENEPVGHGLILSGVVTTRTYDPLSRILTDTTAGRALRSSYDDAGDEVALQYPSGEIVGREFDGLDRPAVIGSLVAFPNPGQQPAVTGPVARYGFRGEELTASVALGRNGTPALQGTMTFDGARRLLTSGYTDPSGRVAMGETVTWTPRSLKQAETRRDENGAGPAFQYDSAGRLTHAAWPTSLGVRGLADAWSFQVDTAENLTQQQSVTASVPATTALPPDASGRNRPASVGGVALTWDANGNLASKGSLHFFYDYRNRLTRVSDGSNSLATYTYDAFNRRISKTAGGHTQETVWDGWRPVERFDEGHLAERRTFGLGLDEMVAVDRDVDLDGTIDSTYHPVYDARGNVAMVVDPAGRPIESYEYSPYGKRLVLVNDLQPPTIDQVRVTGNTIRIETSEAVSSSKLLSALQQGLIVLTDTTTGKAIPFTLAQPLTSGAEAWRRIVLTPSTAPAAGAGVRLTIAPGVLEDRFGNKTTTFYDQSFAWTAGDELLSDTAPPRVDQLTIVGGHLKLALSEQVDPATAASSVTVDGAPPTWTLDADGYTLTSTLPLPPGHHTVHLGTDPLDLGGLGLGQAFDQSFTLAGNADTALLYTAPDPNVATASTVGNLYGFQGRPVDAETGFVYFRNRYYDPELGRFVTADPEGYVDGPSVYAFAHNNPDNYSDPKGGQALPASPPPAPVTPAPPAWVPQLIQGGASAGATAEVAGGISGGALAGAGVTGAVSAGLTRLANWLSHGRLDRWVTQNMADNILVLSGQGGAVGADDPAVVGTLAPGNLPPSVLIGKGFTPIWRTDGTIIGWLPPPDGCPRVTEGEKSQGEQPGLLPMLRSRPSER